MLSNPDTKNYMTVSPVTLLPSTGIYDAIQALLKRSISGATVVDDQGKVVGVISEMDCLRAILSGTYHGQVGGTVGDYMTKEVESVSPDKGILDVARQLVDGHRRRLPIVDEGKFVGQYSCRSMLRAVSELANKPS